MLWVCPLCRDTLLSCLQEVATGVGRAGVATASAKGSGPCLPSDESPDEQTFFSPPPIAVIPKLQRASIRITGKVYEHVMLGPSPAVSDV